MYSIRVILGTNDTERNFDLIIILLLWKPEEKNLKILCNLLLQNYWTVSYETLLAASVCYGKQTLQIRIFMLSLLWLPWKPKEKRQDKCIKIFSSKTTDTILIKHHQNHNCDIGRKRHSTVFFYFIIVLVDIITESEKIILLDKYLKLFSSKTTDRILMLLHQKHQCDMGSKHN